MHPSGLIGKKAIRTKPLNLRKANDYSYTSSPVTILAVTENHIIFKDGYSDKKRILDCRWCDNNWTDYDELMKLADENHIKLMQKIKKSISNDCVK